MLHGHRVNSVTIVIVPAKGLSSLHSPNIWLHSTRNIGRRRRQKKNFFKTKMDQKTFILCSLSPSGNILAIVTSLSARYAVMAIKITRTCSGWITKDENRKLLKAFNRRLIFVCQTDGQTSNIYTHNLLHIEGQSAPHKGTKRKMRILLLAEEKKWIDYW